MDWPPELPDRPQPSPSPTAPKTDKAQGKTPLYRLQPADRLSSISVNEHAPSPRPDAPSASDTSSNEDMSEASGAVSPTSSLRRSHAYDDSITDEGFDGLRALSKHYQQVQGSPSRGRSPDSRSGESVEHADAVGSSRRFHVYDDGVQVEELVESASSHADAEVESSSTGGASGAGGSDGSGGVAPMTEAEQDEEARRRQRLEWRMEGLWWWSQIYR